MMGQRHGKRFRIGFPDDMFVSKLLVCHCSKDQASQNPNSIVYDLWPCHVSSDQPETGSVLQYAMFCSTESEEKHVDQCMPGPGPGSPVKTQIAASASTCESSRPRRPPDPEPEGQSSKTSESAIDVDIPVGNDADSDIVVSLKCRSLSELLDFAEAMNEDLARKLLLGRKRKREVEEPENDSRVGDHSVADMGAGPDTPSEVSFRDYLAADEGWMLNDNGEAVVCRIINGAIVTGRTLTTVPTTAPTVTAATEL